VECNSRDWEEEDFESFLRMIAKLYPMLKHAYPSLPVFVSYMVTLNQESVDIALKINPYSDMIALSAYPYMEISSFVNGSTEPASIPDDFFTRFIEIDKSKPFAIAETGYIAENLDLTEYGITKMGTPKWQAEYLEMIFRLCNKHHATFLTYFDAYDYDNGYNTMQAVGIAAAFFKMWKDIGFYDGNGMERPSLQVWKKWYKANLKL
jgi:hypothetical protein